MTFVPTDEGILGVISKLDNQNPEAAAMLLRLGLFESLQDQLEVVRPQMTAHIYKQMETINKRARTALLRNHVAKAAAGEEEPDDAEFAEGISVLDAHIEKGLVGWALSLFNDQHKRGPNGRFTRTQGPQHPDTGHMRGDAVDLTRAVLGTNSPTASRLTGGLFSDADHVANQTGNANQWYGDTQGTERQTYNRLRLTGSALQQMGEPGSAAHTVGTAANLIGNIGPEAEKVLGPGIRRTAYRYRGTERRPDEAVVRPVDEANQIIRAYQSEDPNVRARASAQLETLAGARGKIDPVAQIASREMASTRTSADKKALTIRGNTAVASMIGVGSTVEEGKNLLPDLELTQLSIESGEMPPSQGVIIDRQGNLVTQAVGYNGDHYLPFDLRNLGALYGGQYVRTRATGGPTTEDIYTGLLTGARQIQVVSNSGVFTVEFDPDLRGGRRYNDKVHRMIERYESMLSTIQGGSLYETDISPERMKTLRRDALVGARDSTEFEANLNVLKDRERLKGRATEDDEDTSSQQAEDWADGKLRAEEKKNRDATGQNWSPQQRARQREGFLRQYKRESAEGTVRRLRLDGEGYNRALKALQQEFPYYIRTATFEPLPRWLESHGLERGVDQPFNPNAPADLGYVLPGQTNTKRGYENADGTKRRGFRAAREVPTTAPGRTAAAAPTDTTTPTATPRAEGQPAAEGAQVRLSGPAAQANAPRAEAQTVEQLAKPGGKVFEEANKHVADFFGAASMLYNPMRGAPAPDGPEAKDFVYNTTNQFKSQYGNTDRARRAFTDWYLNTATQEERDKFDEGINGPNGSFSYIARFDEPELTDNEGEINRAWEEFKRVADILHPFATPNDDHPALTAPSKFDPRPIPFEGIPPVTAKDEEFEHFIGQLRIHNPDAATLVEQMTDIGSLECSRITKMAVDSGDEERAGNTQLAWAVVHAREKAKQLRDLTPGTDAAPLEEVSAAYRPRRLIFG